MDELKKRIRERLRQMEVGVMEELEYCENPFEGRKDELLWVLRTIEEMEDGKRNEAWGDY